MENEWSKVKLVDIIQFNPKESIKKGEIAKKVAMEKLEPFTRKISGFEEAKFTSGTKFRNGDTLLARITPCLENGKTAQVDILDKDEIGFGSTEYIVLREKLGITDNDFIYYLSISPEFRNVAIKAMNGSSGRQRVQKDVLENSEFLLPPLDEQKAIAKILSDLDEKIEINNKINKKLEEMAKAIFKQWFVDFEFPNEDGKPYKSSGGEMVESELGMIPNGWEVIEFMDIMNISSGKRPTKKNNEKTSEFTIPLAGASSIMGYVKEYNYDEPILVIGRVGTHGVVQRFNGKVWASDNTLVITSTYHEFTYQILNRIDYSALNRGSTQPLITQTDIKKQKIVKAKCELLNEYEKITGDIFNTINNNNKEIDKLVLLRDTLLPKLMSGEIRVPID